MSGSFGLYPSEVAVSEPSDDWTREYELERAKLGEILGKRVFDIQHVGSTAVPGLCAKPIIDIAIAVPSDFDFNEISNLLLSGGYQFAVDAGANGGYIFYRESPNGARTHHLHIIDVADSQWANYLEFRERLRQDPQIRQEYARLKSELAEKFPHNRDSYTLAKAEFIASVIDAHKMLKSGN